MKRGTKRRSAPLYFCPKCEAMAVRLFELGGVPIAGCDECGYTYELEPALRDDGPVGV